MGEREINAFLTDLATRRQEAPSTQNQALAALLFLYRHVLRRDTGDLDGVKPASIGPEHSHIRLTRWLGIRQPPDSDDKEISARRTGVAMAMGVSAGTTLAKPKDRRRGPTPCSPDDHPAGRSRGRPTRRYPEARHLPHLQAFLRDASAGIRLRHPYHSGASRPRRREDDYDLHSRPHSWSQRRSKPHGSTMIATRPLIQTGYFSAACHTRRERRMWK